MPLFVSIARHESLLIKATGNICSAWKKNEHGHGSYLKGGIPYPGDRGLEVGINVRVRPRGNLTDFSIFPEDFQASGELVGGANESLGLYAIKAGKVGAIVMVGALATVLQQQAPDPIYFKPIILVQGKRRVHIRMVVSVRILPSPPLQIGNIPEWDTQFFQGGLPSLGKKRP
jgi:hypothetical protein